MTPIVRPAPTRDMLLLVAGWVVLFVILLRQRLSAGARPGAPAGRELKRDRVSFGGMALQGAAFALVFGIRRSESASIPSGGLGGAAFTVLIAALLSGSLVLTVAALRVLGRGWSLAARVLEGHELATAGPYRFVRHPIYTAMLGFLCATALALSSWPAFLAALALCLLGTRIRITREDRLLRSAFGARFEDYARRVPALFPMPRPR